MRQYDTLIFMFVNYDRLEKLECKILLGPLVKLLNGTQNMIIVKNNQMSCLAYLIKHLKNRHISFDNFNFGYSISCQFLLYHCSDPSTSNIFD